VDFNPDVKEITKVFRNSKRFEIIQSSIGYACVAGR